MLYRKSRGKDNTIRQKNQTIIEPLQAVEDPRRATELSIFFSICLWCFLKMSFKYRGEVLSG